MYASSGPKKRESDRIVSRVLLLLIVLVSFVFLILWRTDSPRVESMRMALADLFLPSITWINAPIGFVSDMVHDYETFLTVYEQNRRLRREIQHLQSWRETAWRLEEENAQLRALNRIGLPPRTTFVTGRIVADSGGPFLQSALVNVGRSDGVISGSTAVEGNGVVGRVVGLGNHAARLLLLTDFSSRVPVVIRPSGTRAILAGDGTPAPVIRFLASDDQIHPGDLIETSGAGGVFPPNLHIGRLTATPKKGWRATLAADSNRLEFVRLLQYLPDRRIDRPGAPTVDKSDITVPDTADSGQEG